jgi:hypothetical protein
LVEICQDEGRRSYSAKTTFIMSTKIPTTIEMDDGWRTRDVVEVDKLAGEPVGSGGAAEAGQSRGENKAERSSRGFSSLSLVANTGQQFNLWTNEY